MRPPRLPALVLAGWLATTLFWWAFAFAPLPSRPPGWLSAARYACFGTIASGLPAPSGWLLLVFTPATFLVGIVVLWGSELKVSVLGAARTPAGQALIAVLGVAVIVEGTWVAAKLGTAQRVEAWSAATVETATRMPHDYPRQAATAPEVRLVDQRGNAVSLEAFRGRPVVVTFVFAHCEALCPMIVDTLKRAVPSSAPTEVFLVTLDPWRDTVSALPAAARHWGIPDNFHLLSSPSVEDVLGAARAYGVPFERDEKTGDISHPGLVFLIDRDGRLAYTFNNPSVDWMRDALRRLG